MNAVEPPVRTALFNGRDLYRVSIESRKVDPRLPKKNIGFHLLDIDIVMDTGSMAVGADNTAEKMASRSNLCTGP